MGENQPNRLLLWITKNIGGIVFTRKKLRKNNSQPSIARRNTRGVCPLRAESSAKGSI